MSDNTKRYQVISACVLVPVRSPDGQQVLQTLYRGVPFDANSEDRRIVHNVESGYIVEVAPTATVGVDAAGTPLSDDHPTANDGDPGDPVGADEAVSPQRTAAAAKLPTDGTPPRATHGEDVWVEYATRNGMTYAEAREAGKAELMRRFKDRPKQVDTGDDAELADLRQRAIAQGLDPAEVNKASVEDLKSLVK